MKFINKSKEEELCLLLIDEIKYREVMFSKVEGLFLRKEFK